MSCMRMDYYFPKKINIEIITWLCYYNYNYKGVFVLDNKLNHSNKFTRNLLTKNVGLEVNEKTAFKSKYFNISVGYNDTQNPIYVAFNKQGEPYVYDVNLGKVLTKEDGFNIELKKDAQYKKDREGFNTDKLAYYSVENILITDENNNKKVYANGVHAETGETYRSIERLSESRTGSKVFVCVNHDNTFDLIKPHNMNKLEYNHVDLGDNHNPYLYSIINIEKPYDSFRKFSLKDMLDSFEGYFGNLSSQATDINEKRNIGEQKANLLNAVIENISTQYKDAQPKIENYEKQIESAKNDLDLASKMEVDWKNEKEIKRLQSRASDIIRDNTDKLLYLKDAVNYVPEIKKYLQSTLEAHDLAPARQKTAQKSAEKVAEQERELGR